MEEGSNTESTTDIKQKDTSNEELKERPRSKRKDKKARQSLDRNMSFYKYYKAQQLFKLPEFEAMYKVIPHRTNRTFRPNLNHPPFTVFASTSTYSF